MAHMQQMLLAPKGAIGDAQLSNETISASASSPVSATCSVTFNTDGTLTFVLDGAAPASAWNTEASLTGIGDGWEVQFTTKSGSAPNVGDATGQWHALTSSRTTGMTRDGASAGSRAGVATIELRPAGGGPITSADYDITATVS